jgi:hypothetical protein
MTTLCSLARPAARSSRSRARASSDTIETDAPETIDDLGDATIKVTVKDDEQVLVGITDVTIVKVAGQGIIGDGSSAVVTKPTSNGAVSFDYSAGVAPDRVVFRITAGKQRTSVTILVVDPDAEEEVVVVEPDPEPLTWSRDLIDRWNVVSWSGEDTSAADATAGTNIEAIWHWDGNTFTWYFPGESDSGIPNTLSELSTGEGYFVYLGAGEESAE